MTAMFEVSALNQSNKRVEKLYRTLFLMMVVLLICPRADHSQLPWS